MDGNTASPRLERLPAVLGRVGASRSTLYSWIKAGTFPRPVPLGSPHIVAFVSTEIDSWIDARVREARPAV